ncbi:pyridoxamine 5'-phosphate oxidase family protein [Parvularcula dongshanensis]|uniref:Pyridoxamine 5'-phosphate oxidase N-terminal domain-containing protein n=1 Tax=Parvularcula dongshanensis TaxID=1173995 RepID=A0A840I055_9PROT|nr:pyridoxamine 5'-phosphate oxidase family protein [Parvularcula dongshanensis]MBB4657634.1 hypothetical protein [Parvularcula dongshanensis]
MARFYDALTDQLTRFIEAQPMFFVASAAPTGRINLSPKGMDSFRVLSPNEAAYLDLSGSGAETAAHLRADGRLTVMFNSFGDAPLILRLYGHGRYEQKGSAFYEANAHLFPDLPGARGLVVLAIDSVQTSCGYAVPQMSLDEERDTLLRWSERKGEAGLAAYQAENNAVSIDGLPTGLVDA